MKMRSLSDYKYMMNDNGAGTNSKKIYEKYATIMINNYVIIF